MKTYGTRAFGWLVLVCLFLAFFTNFVVAAEKAEDFPNKPITIYVSSSAGGSTDLTTRAIADAASKILKQPIACVNKPGGLGALAISELLSKKADGYSLATLGYGLVTVVPHMQNLPFSALDDFTHIMSCGRYTFGLAVKADGRWKTWEEFRDYAKQNPGRASYGMSGAGNPVHIAMERIGLVEGIKWKVVTYKGGAEAIVQVLGGHLDAVTSANEVFPHHKNKTLRVLLLMSPGDRLKMFPEIPTIEEKGYKFSANSGLTFCAPKGLPEPIRQKLEDAFKKAMEDPDFLSLMDRIQMVPAFLSGSELVKMWRADYPVQGQVLKQLGLSKEK